MLLHLMHLYVFKVKNAKAKGRVLSASLGTETAPSLNYDCIGTKQILNSVAYIYTIICIYSR